MDERSIVDVKPEDLIGYTQCHFFAGIAGWALAARLAGWPDDRELWTGSCPCQPFSAAGKQLGVDDPRHLWPHYFRLARARRPNVLMGEQVAAAVGKDWLDGVAADLEGIGYACGAVVVPACAVDAPHRRDRLWFVAHADAHGRHEGVQSLSGVAPERIGCGGKHCVVGDPHDTGSQEYGRLDQLHLRREQDKTSVRPTQHASFWAGASWVECLDGKARRHEPSIPLLGHGIPARVGRLRAYGNAIVPQVAAEVIGAYMDVAP